MTANERFEKAWGAFLVYLNRNPKAQLTPFLEGKTYKSSHHDELGCAKKDIQFYVPSMKSAKPRRQPAEKKQKHLHQVQA